MKPMHTFDVWAPRPAQVEIEIGGRRAAMHRRDDGRGEDRGEGWWTLTVADAGPGTDYAFALDGGPARPDPRSRRQPHGVHSASRLFDPAVHRWQDGAWPGIDVLGRVFYELHVGTFTAAGTFDAAIEHLDHLLGLGVDVVELLPVTAFDGTRGWGYDGVSFGAVHEVYGGPAGLQRFVDACHVRGLAVCLDVVHNHLGPSGNYLAEFGPYFHETHRTPWGQAINLDGPDSLEVRSWIIDSALGWFTDFHVDALRLDAVHALIDHSPRHLLAELSDATAELAGRLRRPLALIAESDLNDPLMVEPTTEGGRGMTAQWSDDLHHSLHAWITGERQGYYYDFGDELVAARALTRVFRHADDWSSFRGANWGRPVDPHRHRGHAFLGYLQNHDQIGNRALGDRISADAALGRVIAGATLVLTSPFTPMLFMGEEWAASTPWQFFSDFDGDLGAAVRQGRRAEFAGHGWAPGDVPDPQDVATRDRSVLRWDELGSEPHASVLAWYRALISLRRKESDLRSDDLAATSVTTGPDWLVQHRGGLDVLVNLAAEHRELPTTDGAAVLLAWPGAEAVRAGERGLVLPPDGVAVVRRRP